MDFLIVKAIMERYIATIYIQSECENGMIRMDMLTWEIMGSLWSLTDYVFHPIQEEIVICEWQWEKRVVCWIEEHLSSVSSILSSSGLFWRISFWQSGTALLKTGILGYSELICVPYQMEVWARVPAHPIHSRRVSCGFFRVIQFPAISPSNVTLQ